jgi:hypothetical protein
MLVPISREVITAYVPNHDRRWDFSKSGGHLVTRARLPALCFALFLALLTARKPLRRI